MAEPAFLAGSYDPDQPGPPAITGAGLHRAQDDARHCVLLGDVWAIDGAPPGPEPAVVLLDAWARTGDDTLARTDGAFVVVLWDDDARRGILARDRMGGRTVILARRGRGLELASETHVLLGRLAQRPAVDELSVARWLVEGELGPDRTLYEGVERLATGHLIRLGERAGPQEAYWRVQPSRPLRVGRDEGAGLVRSTIETAIADRISGHRTVGVLLSGGLDSSSVAALASRVAAAHGAELRAYSAVFPCYPGVDESGLIAQTAERLGLPWVRLEVRSGSPLAGALAYTAAYGLPLVSPNHDMWMPLLGRAAADGVTVMLDGEGGDELFRAATHLLADRLARGRVLSALRLARSLPGAGDHPPWTSVIGTVRHLALPALVPEWLRAVRSRRRPAFDDAPPGWLRPATADALATARGAPADLPSRPRWWRQLAEMLAAGAREGQDADTYLRHRAQLAGLEARPPLLDGRLAELMLQLPPELAYDPHRDRPLLRGAVAGMLPDAVRLRPEKSYFDAVVMAGLAESGRAMLEELLGDPGAEIGRWVDLAAVRATLLDRSPDEHRDGPGGWSWEAWRLATTEVWLRHERDPASTGRMLESSTLTPPSVKIVG